MFKKIIKKLNLFKLNALLNMFFIYNAFKIILRIKYWNAQIVIKNYENHCNKIYIY